MDLKIPEYINHCILLNDRQVFYPLSFHESFVIHKRRIFFRRPPIFKSKIMLWYEEFGSTKFMELNEK